MNLATWLEWVGKLLFVAFFVMSGINHLVNLRAMTGYAQSKKVPAPGVAVVATGVMMLVASAFILSGWNAPWGYRLLAIFLLPTAIMMHNYWVETDPMTRANQQAQFWKNITIAGAAIMMAV
jgi:uncharacterized membrane protein YphA (DoxX/SURF4 family)